MRISFLCLLAVPLLLLAACDPTMGCPDGTHIDESLDECVPDQRDGGQMDAGDSGEVEPDAGPCGGCSGDTPHCRVDDGACVTCFSNDDCGTDAPFCDESGECASCLADTDCANPTPSVTPAAARVAPRTATAPPATMLPPVT